MLDLFQTNSCRDLGRLYFYPAWGKMSSVKKVVRFMVGFLLFGSTIFPAQAAFTNLYAFGDGMCTTTNNPTPGPLYYGLRRTNGRVWIEVLAQQQGLTYDSNKNMSYFGQDSTAMLAHINSFTAPANATNDLFVVWACDADFVGYLESIYSLYGTNLSKWNNAIILSLTNHFKMVTNLYAKGVRTLVMPNAVDITKVPAYDGGLNGGVTSNDWAFVRGRIIYFNTNFIATLNQAKSLHPDLTIFVPDMFTLLNNVITNAAYYGLTNALYNGQSIDAVEFLPNVATNGPGTNFIFWDMSDPTAKFHSVIADVVQQLISPVQITNLTALNGSNQLVVANVPIGQNGLVLGRTDLLLGNWATNATFVSSNTTQTVYVTNSSPQWFYRLKFPYTWAWP